MIYGRGGDGGGGYSDFRIIPTDGRAFDPRAILQTKFTGHSVGHWEGDTLVIESVGFTPETWLARGGFFHSEDMKVTEKFTAKGDQVLYEVTVEDPQVFIQPWTQKPMLHDRAWTSAGPGGPGRGVTSKHWASSAATASKKSSTTSRRRFATSSRKRAPGVDQTSGAFFLAPTKSAQICRFSATTPQ